MWIFPGTARGPPIPYPHTSHSGPIEAGTQFGSLGHMLGPDFHDLVRVSELVMNERILFDVQTGNSLPAARVHAPRGRRRDDAHRGPEPGGGCVSPCRHRSHPGGDRHPGGESSGGPGPGQGAAGKPHSVEGGGANDRCVNLGSGAQPQCHRLSGRASRRASRVVRIKRAGRTGSRGGIPSSSVTTPLGGFG